VDISFLFTAEVRSDCILDIGSTGNFYLYIAYYEEALTSLSMSSGKCCSVFI
jgi:hypothetical protein